MRCPECGHDEMIEDGACLVCPNCATIFTVEQAKEYWECHSAPENVHLHQGKLCQSCNLSLSGGDYTPPWADGNNEYGYTTCPHCGHKNIRYID